MNSTDRLFLLDAYALIYRAYYALIKMPRINSKGFNTSAILGFVNTLEEVLKKEKPTHIGVAFDPSGPTFRHEAYEQYKAQREETPEVIRLSVPIIKDIIRAYRIPILEVPGYEADDVIGTLATQAAAQGIDTYMMTPDKDYGQLVGPHIYMYRPKHTGGFEVMGVAEVKAKYNIAHTGQMIDMLGLMGDASDNIPGCPGVGEKTAQKLIEQFGGIDALLQNTHQLKGALKTKVENNREQILFSKFLATIKTDVPVQLDMESLRHKQPDSEALRQLFEELEFRTLLSRVLGAGSAPTPHAELNNSARRDLFSGTLFSATPPASSPAAPSSPSQAKAESLPLFPTEGADAPENLNLKSLKDLSVDYKLIENEAERVELLRKLMTAEFLAIDTETTGTDAMTAEPVGVSLSDAENRAYYLPVPSSREKACDMLSTLRSLLENPAITKVGQNLKYDLLVLKRYGVEVKGPLFDTMLAHYVLQPELRHNLDYLAEIYLHYRTIHIDELIGPKGKAQRSMRDLPPADIYQYACEDADVALKLMHLLQDELKKQGVEHLFYDIEMPLLPVLVHLESNGVRLDTDALQQSSFHFRQRLEQIEQDIYRLAGETFNIASPKQVGEVLFDKLKLLQKPKKTKTGQYVTSEEVLESLRSKHEIVARILEHRGLKKLLGTYVDALPSLINPQTGRIHTSFNQAVTATGRLSSSNPNLQNIPIRDEDGKEIRKAFIPDEGCLFFSADYSQIELRIMAHLSQDEAMIEAFCSGHDIHAATAAKIYHIPIDQVTSDMRRKAKTANFGIIYGISVFGLAERMGVSRQEAKELIDGYFATYPQVKAYMDQSIERARQQGYVETVFGRKRYLPDIGGYGSHRPTVHSIRIENQDAAAGARRIELQCSYGREGSGATDCNRRDGKRLSHASASEG